MFVFFVLVIFIFLVVIIRVWDSDVAKSRPSGLREEAAGATIWLVAILILALFVVIVLELVRVLKSVRTLSKESRVKILWSTASKVGRLLLGEGYMKGFKDHIPAAPIINVLIGILV